MVGTNLKAETLSLMDKRTEIEAEMDAIISRLCVPGGPGLRGNLVDAEGFPRADIDIPAVCGDRHRLSVLRIDHKELTDKIEKNIEILHSGHLGVSLPQKRTAEGDGVAQLRSNSGVESSASDMVIDEAPQGLPFAVFDEVQEGSPAAVDGIMYGDQLLKFGSVEGGDNLLLRLAREGHVNEGNPIPVVVLRRGVKINLFVTPRPWSGTGVLGCHIRQL